MFGFRSQIDTGARPSLLVILGLAAVLLTGTGVRAQIVLDLLDGETLYDGGSLISLGFGLSRGERLRTGENRVADPAQSHEQTLRTTLAYQYGWRHDLQIGMALSFVEHERVGAGLDLSADGLGDLEIMAKWRFYRWDARAKALNIALIGSLSLPTGEDDEVAGGMRLEPELQPGSGGIDPALGFGATYEPGRWRYNAAALYRWRTDTDGDHTRLGDGFVGELAIGNRFWLEPYPGPFMRWDLAGRYYFEDESRSFGILPGTGGERAALAANLAFRPRPSIDIQIEFEAPIWQRVEGTQLGEDWTVHLSLGYRF